MQLISNFAAAAAAGTVLRILDFTQQNGFDLTSGGCADFTPVQSFQAFAGLGNQAWTLTGGPLSWQIVSNCNTFLTYPGAGSAIALRSQATTRSTATTSWNVSLVNPLQPTGPWLIIEESSGAALTAWDHSPNSVLPDSPITLEELNATNDTRQQFWFVSFD
ncbi:hypothetical protein B0H11DRAFT_2119430 [Mycena galericulata]|nr:hypothetical protein B0H11DRAFT_2119430 [Mycena galericulata]